MRNSEALACVAARERLSARMDGELERELDDGLDGDRRALAAHLARCAACRTHERALTGLQGELRALRAAGPEPLADLWPRIEARARRRTRLAPLARVAAALVGFLGLGGAALVLERAPAGAAPDRTTHLFERLAPAPQPDALFAALPEYRLLRALPGAPTEESR